MGTKYGIMDGYKGVVKKEVELGFRLGSRLREKREEDIKLFYKN